MFIRGNNKADYEEKRENNEGEEHDIIWYRNLAIYKFQTRYTRPYRGNPRDLLDACELITQGIKNRSIQADFTGVSQEIINRVRERTFSLSSTGSTADVELAYSIAFDIMYERFKASVIRYTGLADDEILDRNLVYLFAKTLEQMDVKFLSNIQSVIQSML